MSDETGFDRLRRRGPHASSNGQALGRPSDPQGRRSIYSVAPQEPPFGAVTVNCSRCGRTSVISPQKVLTLAVPSLHLPFIRRDHPSWMRCPSCRHRTWVRLRLKL